MDAHAVARIFADLRGLLLLILSLLCCFGLVYFFFKTGVTHRKGITPDAHYLYFCEFLLVGGIAVWLWRSLLYRPGLLFAPIVAFFFVCLHSRETKGNPPC